MAATFLPVFDFDPKAFEIEYSCTTSVGPSIVTVTRMIDISGLLSHNEVLVITRRVHHDSYGTTMRRRKEPGELPRKWTCMTTKI